jgi:DNA-binding FadR family transcriptional regulator
MKSGQRLAIEIEEGIITGAIPAGTNLGSEPDLVERYGASRPIFREAVRLVEHDGLAIMRKGPAGGLVVIEPNPDAASHAATVWLRRNQATLDEVFATRELIEPACALRAAEQTRGETRNQLLALLDHERQVGPNDDFSTYNRSILEFHQNIAELSGNRVCWLFLQTLSELTIYFGGAATYSIEELDETEHAHRLIAQAIIAGDGPLASHRMIIHMRASRQFSQRLLDRPRSSVINPPDEPNKQRRVC